MSPSSTSEDIDEYFIDAVKRHAKIPPCSAIALGLQFRHAAVTKSRSKHHRADKDLLFPPSLIRRLLTRENVLSVFGCKCTVCNNGLGDANLLSTPNLVQILTEKDGHEADNKRRLFSVLLFMGAGFVARRLCAMHTEGLDIAPHEEVLRRELFTPLQSRGLFRSSKDPTAHFISIFNEARKIFEAPKFEIGNDDTFVAYKNLPFLKDTPLGDHSQKPPDRGRLFSFEIHREFCGKNIPSHLVRKEIDSRYFRQDEKTALQFLDHPHVVKLMFSYRHGDKVNYVFKRYAGSLQEILDGTFGIGQEAEQAAKPQRYRGPKLQHWLWQGAVDIVEALAFFHAQTFSHPFIQGQRTAAHFDVKPANILLDNDNSLVLADFGDAQIVDVGARFNAEGGDYTYKPPRKSKDQGWSQAYDVWSMACVLTEVIEYITNRNGPDAFKNFQRDRERDNQSNLAFWAPDRGIYVLRPSVRNALVRFRSSQDQYLNSVTDLLERMFSIDELNRPSMAECFAKLSENAPREAYPLKDEGEISISGPGTKPLLRNMLTQFEREIRDRKERHGCKMYMLLEERLESKRRVRLAIEFEKIVDDGNKLSCVVSDSARYQEEEIKLVSLFDRDPPYNPRPAQESLCSFEVMHPNMKFIFHEPTDYYDFLAATTRQKLYLLGDSDEGRYVRMPIRRCIVRPSALFGGKSIIFRGGHLQIWRELSDEEYAARFAPLAITTSSQDRKGSNASSIVSSTAPEVGNHMRVATNQTTKSSSSGSSTNNERRLSTTNVRANPLDKLTLPRRVVIFLPGQSSNCCLTIDIANSKNRLQDGLDSNKTESSRHLTIKGDFFIGKFETEKDYPAIPIHPKALQQRENFKVEWVQIEFADENGLKGFRELCWQNGKALFR